jgi:pilus assembly protein TadC
LRTGYQPHESRPTHVAAATLAANPGASTVDARTRKRQAAEELAQKAPIKMIFPLASCFFPSILIVAAGPGVLALMKALGCPPADAR